MAKTKTKKTAKAEGVEVSNSLKSTRSSDDPLLRKDKWVNKSRVLVFAARGISHRDRHLMRDLKILMPHHRSESKMERSKTFSVINDICEMRHCSKAVLFEGRHKRDLYAWFSNVPNGASTKFLVENIHTMGELKMSGNCLRGARPLLSFDSQFDEIPHLSIIKESFIQIFGVPNYHPKSQPFFDHVYTFTLLDNRIWFRNFQILSEAGGLAEIGPRFVLNPIKIFDGSFTGKTLWENPDYVSPARQRQMVKKIAKDRYVNRLEQKVTQEATRPKHAYEFNELDDVFETKNPIKKAQQLAEQLERKIGRENSKKNMLENNFKDTQIKKVKRTINKKIN